MTDSQQFCTFYIDDYCFGINVLRVQEVIRYQEMTAVPLSDKVIEGLINLRGQIVTAIDLRKRLGFETKEDLKGSTNVVIKAGDGAVSLLVDSIGDVVEVETDSFEKPPATLTGFAKDLITGVYKRADSLLLILDTDKTLQLKKSKN